MLPSNVLFPANDTTVDSLLQKVRDGKKDDPAAVVIGIVGHNQAARLSVANALFDRPLFKGIDVFQVVSASDKSSGFKSFIEVAREPDDGRIVLNLVSAHDPTLLQHLLGAQCTGTMSSGDKHMWMMRLEYQFLKALLYLFHVCHIVLVVEPATDVDATLVNALRVLQLVRLETQGPMLDRMAELPLPPDVRGSVHSPPRCQPVLAFVFHQHERGDKAAVSETELRSTLQTIVSSSAHGQAALFSLDSAKCAHVLACDPAPPSPLDKMLFAGMPFGPKFADPVTSDSGIPALQDWLAAHIKLLNGTSAARKQLPSLRQWLVSSLAVQSALFGAASIVPQVNTGARAEAAWSYTNDSCDQAPLLQRLRVLLDPTAAASAETCLAALPTAVAAYLADLPDHYTVITHQEHQKTALATFQQLASGPAADYFARRLRDQLGAIWRAGRQLCDGVSLTGRPCTLPLHRLMPGDQPSENDSSTPVLAHCSGFRALHACSCGRSRRIREDPFDFKEAAAHLESLAQICCRRLESLPISDGGQLGSNAAGWSLHRLGAASYYDPASAVLQDGFRRGQHELLTFRLVLDARTLRQPPRRGARSSSVALSGAARGKADGTFAAIVEAAAQRAQLRGPSSSNSQLPGPKLSSGRLLDGWRARGQAAAAAAAQASHQGRIGFEYECPHGHRFFATPDQLPRSSAGSSFVIQLEPPLSSQLPLHLLCHCGKSPAQLQRVFIVTPTTARPMALRPMVQFQSAPKLSYSGDIEAAGDRLLPDWPATIALPPDSTLVLKLPYVYAHDGKPIVLRGLNDPYVGTIGLHLMPG
eukprot:TRINITY_DN14814_c0_g1_i1.p1 TRINITY_DN14814_c0_g1~~TRINITY_DN14814_c0_g1_i1.p1  ORF type:complete len:815 (-),score=228.60 TRINITY_DN14814_c0_g1_i1:491-2935(-)